MTRRIATLAIVAFWGLLVPAASFAAGTMPGWVKALSDSSDPTALSGDAVLLQDARLLRVTPEGVFVTVHRRAVLVRRREGAVMARAYAPYVEGQSRIRELRGWVIRKGAVPRELDGRNTLDVAVGENDLFSEARARIFDASQLVGPGEVFAFEWTTEDETPFLQVDLALTGELSTRRAEVRVELPPRWKLEAHVFGPARPLIETSPGNWAWACLDHPGVPDEDSAPSPHLLSTRVALRIIPDSRVRAADFSDWNQVAAWLHDLAKSPGSASGSTTERGVAIRQSANGEMDALRAAVSVAQQVRYVSIQMGIGRGGGYQPHAAAQVLKTGYGDCKDKANLLVTLVRAMGGRAWLAPTFLGDRDFVHAEWATPQQFNHCIAAIAVSDTVRADAVIHDPRLGSLLLVDPTDPFTPLGQLPEVEQGGQALIVEDSAGVLVRLPAAPLDRIGMDCRVEATLDADGTVRATHLLSVRGDLAAELRSTRAARGDGAIQQALLQSTRATAPGVSLSSLRWADDPDGTLRIRYETVTKDDLQDLGGGTSAWRALGNPFGPPDAVRTSARVMPIVVKRERCSEIISLRMPSQWTLVESPPDRTIERDGASFRSRTASEPGRIIVERDWVTNGGTLPPDRYAGVREVLSAAQAGVRALHVIRSAP